MIEYFETLMQEEQDALTEVIRLLYHQTFILERKYEKRTERFQYSKEYKICSKHLEFLKSYFAVAGIALRESSHMGIIYIQGEMLLGDKLSKLATYYLLILKLIYDEQMEIVSSSTHIVTTLGAMNGKAGEFHLLKNLPSPTEVRRTISLLKKYQIIEPMDILEELNENSKMIIYPCVNAVLLGEDVRELLMSFSEEEDRDEESAIQSTIADMPE